MQTTDTIEGVVLTYYIGFEFGSERILNDIVPSELKFSAACWGEL